MTTLHLSILLHILEILCLTVLIFLVTSG